MLNLIHTLYKMGAGWKKSKHNEDLSFRFVYVTF